MNLLSKSKRINVALALGMLGFVIFKTMMGGLETPHLLFAFGLPLLYSLHPLTRKYLILALPVILFVILYDSFRYIPFESLLPIHIQDLYEWDLKLFGIHSDGVKVLFHEWVFQIFSHPFWDIFCAAIYSLHVPMVLMMLAITWKLGSDQLAQRYAIAFLLMNLGALATYYLLPAAPPWYVDQYQFIQPTAPIPGDAAGLAKIDELLGFSLFASNYKLSTVTFGALPSMHAGFACLSWLYSLQLNRKLIIVLGVYVLSMLFSALYLQHHYFIDVLLGISYALSAWWITEHLLSKPIKLSFQKIYQWLEVS